MTETSVFESVEAYEDGPYGDQLRGGDAMYSLRFFERPVLDRYMEDARFLVEEFATGGTLTIKSEFDLAPDTPEEDKIFIQRYLVAYRADDTQAVAVPLRYLGWLSTHHQHHWASHEIHDSLRLDEDSHKQAFEGEWTDRVSPFDALLQECREINRLCDMIGWPHLFLDTFDGENVPGLTWMTKPTAHALDEFVHLLDKLLADNLSRDFFSAARIPLTEEVPRKGGAVEVRDRGTVSLLKELLGRYVRLEEPEILERLVATLREIRQRRRKPAHQVTENRYGRDLLHQQREIMRKAYGAVRDLRLIFMLHPAASDYEPPDWLQRGRIL